MNGSGERLGILGGTFDPPHIGHLVAAVNALSALSLNRVLMVVAATPWQKVGTRDITPAQKRYEMVRVAVEGLGRIEVSDIEIVRGGDSVTAHTVETLLAADPELIPYVIVGRDAAAGLASWRSADRLRDLARIAVVDRPGAAAPLPEGWRFEHVEIPRIDVSSTDVRERVRTGRTIDVIVPAPVVAMIRELGLYGGRP